jgi:hypothetical protein
MKKTTFDYQKYFVFDQKVKIGIPLTDNPVVEVNGIVRYIEGDRLTVEFIGIESAEEAEVPLGAEVTVTTWNDCLLCQCTAKPTQKYCRRIFLHLTGPVSETQSREYFRFNVTIPLNYTIPEIQRLPDLLGEWNATREYMLNLPEPELQQSPDGFKLVRWSDHGIILPHTINLSGGGMRFVTPEYLRPETLVAVSLFLPLAHPAGVIHAMAESLRSSEIKVGRGRGVRYMSALRFHYINDKDRERIIAYLFSEQRRSLKKRVGQYRSENHSR